VQKAGFNDYAHFTVAFFSTILGASLVLAAMVFAYNKYSNTNNVSNGSLVRLPLLEDESVYRFFLGKSWLGRIIALATMGAQISLLFIFVEGVEIDLSSDNVSLVYDWKCHRDQMDCTETADKTWEGWGAFVILMIAYLLKDLINGMKLIVLSQTIREDYRDKVRFFVGGVLLTAVTSFTLFVSSIYNYAIATSEFMSLVSKFVSSFLHHVQNSFIVFMLLDVQAMQK